VTDTAPPRFDRSRLRLGVVIAVVCGALAFLALKGLGDATTYFRNADEAQDQPEGRRFRLQGTVVPGSVEDSAGDVDFEVEYGCVRVAVHHAGAEPELFKAGIPVVLEGEWGAGKQVYEADRIIVRHTEEYTQEEQDRLAAAQQECPTGVAGQGGGT
jgi:cytochrome c-type biogenesis protein CcmE